jgi:hypothetical protein
MHCEREPFSLEEQSVQISEVIAKSFLHLVDHRHAFTAPLYQRARVVWAGYFQTVAAGVEEAAYVHHRTHILQTAPAYDGHRGYLHQAGQGGPCCLCEYRKLGTGHYGGECAVVIEEDDHLRDTVNRGLDGA